MTVLFKHFYVCEYKRQTRHSGSSPYGNYQFTLPKPPVYPTQTQMATLGVTLFRKYGHDPDNERVYFYNANVEVDFYIPEDELAIQVSYSLADEQTREREISALTKLPNIHPCKRRIVITYDEEVSIADKHGTIEVMPCWKWLIG